MVHFYLNRTYKSPRNFLFSGQLWPPVVSTVCQASLLSHTYGVPQPPAYSQGVTIQAPIIGATPPLQSAMPPPHPLLPSHYQLTQPPSQPLASMVLNVHSQTLGLTGLPPIAMSPMPGVCQVTQTGQTVLGNGHLTHPMVQPSTTLTSSVPIINGQASVHPPPTNGCNTQETANGLQMLRTVGMGKYEFTDPWHPKGKIVLNFKFSIKI